MDESNSSVAALFSPLARLLNWRTKPAVTPVALNGHVVQTVEPAATVPLKEENIFSEGLTVMQRLAHLQKWMEKQKFRPTNMDETENRLVREAIAASAYGEHAASPKVISYWHPSQPHRAFIFLAREEPVELRDISVTIFEQAFKQHLHDAYRQAQPPHISLASLIEDGNWNKLESRVNTHSANGNIGAAMYHAEEAARRRFGSRSGTNPEASP